MVAERGSGLDVRGRVDADAEADDQLGAEPAGHAEEDGDDPDEGDGAEARREVRAFPQEQAPAGQSEDKDVAESMCEADALGARAWADIAPVHVAEHRSDQPTDQAGLQGPIGDVPPVDVVCQQADHVEGERRQ